MNKTIKPKTAKKVGRPSGLVTAWDAERKLRSLSVMAIEAADSIKNWRDKDSRVTA